MKNYYITVNPNVSGFIRKQRGLNARLGLGLAVSGLIFLGVENQVLALKNRITQLESRIRELECEKAD